MLYRNRLMLRTLQVHALAKAFLRYRNPRRRASGRHHVAFYDRMWQEAAEQVGASWSAIGGGFAEIRRGGRRIRVCENTCPIDDPVTQAVAADKLLTYRLLEGQGLPVARHAGFTTGSIGKAVRFLESAPGDCVVKPRRGTGGGRGVTTGVRSQAHLARAAAWASVYGDELLIEEQRTGGNYRLLFLDGVLLDAFERRSPTVIADGRSTIARLVDRANAERLRQGSGVSQTLLTIDLDMKNTLDGQGWGLRSVPPTGVEVVLKTVVNENCGSDNTTATDRLDRSVIAAAARAAEAVGVRLAGVDVITSDPSVSLEASGGVILEVNTPPNYYYHYRKSDGAFPVAVHVLERLLGSSVNEPAPEFYQEAIRS